MNVPTSRQRGLIDLVAYDRTGQPILVGEVKSLPMTIPNDLARYTARKYGSAKYVLLVDPVKLRLYRGTPVGDAEPAATLDTPHVFVAYDSDFASRRGFEDYLTILAAAWLDDLANHWKQQVPPGTNELRGTGLLEQLEGGTTGTEVTLNGDPLR